MLLENILPFAHSLLRQALKAGGRALDATAGNGHDTLLLAQSVGETGRVWAFDVQSKALVQTQGRLKDFQTAFILFDVKYRLENKAVGA